MAKAKPSPEQITDLEQAGEQIAEQHAYCTGAKIPKPGYTIATFARLWAAEAAGAAEIIEVKLYLLDAAANGAFCLPTTHEWRKEAKVKPWNYDPRLGMLVETFERPGMRGQYIVPSLIKNTLTARRRQHGDAAVGALAREIVVSIDGLKAWCNRPDFPEAAAAHGLTRPRLLDQSDHHPVASAPPPAPAGEGALQDEPIYRTGVSGKPSSAHLVEPELRRRVKAGEVEPTLKAEAAALAEWLKSQHPQAPPMTAKTIRNRFRGLYRTLVTPC